MITVIDYSPEHLKSMKVKKEQTGESSGCITTYALTFMNADKPLAIFGGFCPSPGVLHVWGLISDDAKKHPIEFHKTALKMLEFYEMRHYPRRIQIDVRSDFSDAQRWAEILGFVREGYMKSYGHDGSDHHLYARVKQCSH